MNRIHITAAMLSMALVMLPAPGFAETKGAAPGAMPNDKTMSCQDVSAERQAINDAVTKGAAKKEQAQKTKKRLFGFAKGLATIAVPGAALLAGGGSSFGNMAAQHAGQSALDAVGNGPTGTTTAEVKPTDQQQARLTRLDSIAAYRQCAA